MLQQAYEESLARLSTFEGYGEKLAALEPQAEVAKRVEAKCAELYSAAADLIVVAEGEKLPVLVWHLADVTQDLAAAVAEICTIVRPFGT